MKMYEDDFFQIGRKIGMLTYTGEYRYEGEGRFRHRKFKFKCDCGKEVWKIKYNLEKPINAGIFGCGCGKLKGDFTHVGKRFGMLTYTGEWEYDKKDTITKYKCICDCGKEVWKLKIALQRKNGGIFGCGCGKVEDEVGNKYGRLTVIKRVENAKGGQTKWLCKCNCGKETIVWKLALKSGQTKSCGCYRSERAIETQSLSIGEACFNGLFRSYKKHAKKRKHSFNLTKEEFRVLTSGNCYYCGVEPRQLTKVKNSNGDYIYNGVDRLDSSRGYLIDNCVCCCAKCNYMKGKLSLEEFKERIKTLYKNMNNW